MDNIRFGSFIAEQRKACDLTQKELAEKLHVTDKAVSKWETGKGFPDLKLMEPLADALGITIYELIDASSQNPCSAGSGGEAALGTVSLEAADRVVRESLDISKSQAKKKSWKTLLRNLVVLLLILYVAVFLYDNLSAGKYVFLAVPADVYQNGEIIDHANVQFSGRMDDNIAPWHMDDYVGTVGVRLSGMPETELIYVWLTWRSGTENQKTGDWLIYPDVLSKNYMLLDTLQEEVVFDKDFNGFAMALEDGRIIATSKMKYDLLLEEMKTADEE